jgi:hypothetical protein
MANISELLVNVVIMERAQDADRLEPKGTWSVALLNSGGTRTKGPPAERQGLTHFVTWVKHGKPVPLPVGAGKPQGKLKAVRVKESGESEGRPVIGRIGVEPPGEIIPRESGQTSTGSFFTREFV